MTHGEGSGLTDADGHDYTDFLGEFTAGIYGHSPRVIKDAVVKALEDGMNLSSHNVWEGRLAAQICERFASMDLVRFTNSGTEANLMALAAACAFTGRRKILVFAGAYHGSVLTFLAGGSHLTVPYEFIVGHYNDIASCEALIRENHTDLAAILVEPMLGAGGCVPGTPQFLQSLRDRSRDIGALLIFDEIQTSRLSIGGRQLLLNIEPDLTTIGKFYGGGLAFGCFGGRRRIMERFDPRLPNAFFHPGTFNNNTLTMAAGSTALDQLLTADALDELNARGDRFRADMLALFDRSGSPFTVSGLGSLMNIHPTVANDQVVDYRNLLFLDLTAAGFYIAARGLIALSLCISDEHTHRFLSALAVILDKRRSLF
jgi:glutamate-1-semialdehyde 2,1-aminomutase